MSGAEGIGDNKPIKGAIEAVTGKEIKTQGVKDLLDTKGVFDVAKESGVPTGGIKDVVEEATGVPMGGDIDTAEKAISKDLSPNQGLLEVVTGEKLPKMGLLHMIDKYGQGVYQTVRNWFQK